jgi:hypothetical protein
VAHEFLPAVSEKLSEGVPAGSNAEVKGPVSGANALTVDAGHAVVAEKVEGTTATRVDTFDAATGAFIEPQWNESGALHGLDVGVAVGHGTGEPETYVGAAEEARGVVVVSSPFGSLQATWTGLHTPAGSFTVSSGTVVGELTGVAVDGATSSLVDWAAGDVYVSTRAKNSESPEGFNVVDVFKPEVGGQEPGKVVAQLTGTCASPGVCPGEVIPFNRPSAIAVSPLNGDVLVVEANRVVDVFEPALIGEYVFVRQLTGPPAGTFERILGVAVDGGEGAGAGDIFVADNASRVVDQFNAEGAHLGRLTGTPARPFRGPRSVAVDPADHHVFVGGFNQETTVGSLDVFGGNVTVPDVEPLPASGVGPLSATLHGTVNLVKEGNGTCQFVWGTSVDFGHTTPCSAPVQGEGAVPVEVKLDEANHTALEPDTTYYYRLQAASDKNGVLNPGEPLQDQHFTTPGPGFHGEWASNLSSTSATLNTELDPHGAATSYFFEYGTSTGYGKQAPGQPVAIGAGEGDVHGEQHVQGLAAGTVYHYRVVTDTELEPGHSTTLDGPDHTFTTQNAGGGLALADGRQWELVSPADKHGALVEAIGEEHVTQAATGGDAMTFLTDSPTEREPDGYATLVQVLATRGPEGWQSRDIATAHARRTGYLPLGEYHFFSEDLSSSAVQQFGSFTPSLSPEASEQTPYLRKDFLEGDLNKPCLAAVMHCYQPFVTGKPGHANVPEGTVFGDEGLCPPNFLCGPAFVGATPDLSHVVLLAGAALTPGANTGGALYEWSAQSPPSSQLALVSVLPESQGGGPATNSGPQLGQLGTVTRNAISSDGSRIVWSEEGGHHLYLRDMARRETVQLDVPQANAGSGSVRPEFQAASSDGSRVFFTDQQQLTAGAGVGPEQGVGDLYECKVVVLAGKLTCQLSDLTPPASGENAAVQRVLPGASEDGSYVYFVANGALTEGEGAVHGTCNGLLSAPTALCNLYVWHEGATHLVAVLSAEDFPDWNGNGSASVLEALTARVSPDGRWLAFMSQRPLTGYDTRDAVTGRPDEEVYLYHAEPGGAGRLVCASCDPTGARPAGVEYGKTNERIDGAEKAWPGSQGLAASVPGWTGFHGARTRQARHQPRYLSDSGRLFFNAPGALVPGDVNGVGDVYEFEPAGVGGCSAGAGSASVVFLAGGGGCVGLISSGSADEEAGFLDASSVGGRVGEGEGGGDVFFMTSGQLVPGDTDSSMDVYDAHECSSAAPCFPVPAVSPPPCNSGDACKPAPSLQPPVFGSPGSATFSGPGNAIPPPPAKKTAAQVRAEKLTKALKACRTKQNKHKRTVCEREARKKYGALKTAKAKKSANANRGGK